MALVPNRCIGEEEGTRDIGWLACPRGWMISNERIFFYYLGGEGKMLLGMFGTWQMGISCGEGSFLNVLYGRDYILNGKDMLNRYLATKGTKGESLYLEIKCIDFVQVLLVEWDFGIFLSWFFCVMYLYIKVFIKCHVPLEDMWNQKRKIKFLKRRMDKDFVSELVFFFFFAFQKSCYYKVIK